VKKVKEPHDYIVHRFPCFSSKLMQVFAKHFLLNEENILLPKKHLAGI
jgi:hypothetical protein